MPPLSHFGGVQGVPAQPPQVTRISVAGTTLKPSTIIVTAESGWTASPSVDER